MSYKIEYLTLGGEKGSEFFDKILVKDLTKMIGQFNCLAKHFRKHIDDILRRAPKSTFSTIYFADEVMEDKGCED
ncbi:hypothetical protein JHK82_033763 [Glycine max]|nr:hypothetical protein JHK82_033763 [Glycine max]